MIYRLKIIINNNDSCNDNNDYWFKWFDKYFHLGRFPPGVHLPLEYVSVLANHLPGTSVPPATSKACLKYRRKRIGQLLDIFTCSPFVKKLVQACEPLGVARSGREARYLPSESYLGQKDGEDGDNEDLNTCPPSHGKCYRPNPQSWGSHFPRPVHMLPSHCFEESAGTHLSLTIQN